MLEIIFGKTMVQKVYMPILTILIGYLVYRLGKSMIEKTFALRINNKSTTHKREKTIEGLLINFFKYFVVIISFLIILNLYGVNTMALVASLGVAGLVVGLALQDTLKDLVAGAFIILEDQYNVDDYVRIDDFEGQVTGLGLKTTKIRSASGEIKVIANSAITTVINYSACNAVKFVDVGVDYRTDLEKCEQVLRRLCEDLSKNMKLLKEDLQLLGVNELGASSVVYRIRIVANYQDIFALRREVLKEVKLALDKHKINIPYNKVEVLYEK